MAETSNYVQREKELLQKCTAPCAGSYIYCVHKDYFDSLAPLSNLLALKADGYDISMLSNLRNYNVDPSVPVNGIIVNDNDDNEDVYISPLLPYAYVFWGNDTFDNSYNCKDLTGCIQKIASAYPNHVTEYYEFKHPSISYSSKVDDSLLTQKILKLFHVDEKDFDNYVLYFCGREIVLNWILNDTLFIDKKSLVNVEISDYRVKRVALTPKQTEADKQNEIKFNHGSVKRTLFQSTLGLMRIYNEIPMSKFIEIIKNQHNLDWKRKISTSENMKDVFKEITWKARLLYYSQMVEFENDVFDIKNWPLITNDYDNEEEKRQAFEQYEKQMAVLTIHFLMQPSSVLFMNSLETKKHEDISKGISHSVSEQVDKLCHFIDYNRYHDKPYIDQLILMAAYCPPIVAYLLRILKLCSSNYIFPLHNALSKIEQKSERVVNEDIKTLFHHTFDKCSCTATSIDYDCPIILTHIMRQSIKYTKSPKASLEERQQSENTILIPGQISPSSYLNLLGNFGPGYSETNVDQSDSTITNNTTFKRCLDQIF